DGQSLYFISDRGGFANIYRLALGADGAGDRSVRRVTNLATGVSGITDLSPAMSVASQTGLVMYTAFEAQNYNVYALEPEEAEGEPVEPLAGAAGLVDDADGGALPAVAAAGVLPPVDAVDRSRVQGYLADNQTGLPDTRAFPDDGYRPKLQLDYVSQPSVGAGYDPYYGGFGVGGGIALRFSDMLGNNILGVTVQANGTFKDIGGQAIYINRGRRLNWGGVVSHIPYLQVYYGSDEVEGTDCSSAEGVQPCVSGTRYFRRIYLSQAAGLAAYPLSQTRRFEGQAGYRRIGYGFEYDNISVENGRTRIERESLDGDAFGLADDALHLAEASLAYVGDYSFFGFTSPVRGGRYRFEVGGTAGSLNYATATADYRRYFFFKPFFTVAARALHFGRYGGDATRGEFYPLYIGYGVLVRGYSSSSFPDNLTNAQEQEYFERYFGSRIGVANLELRMPLFGTREFGLINFPYLPTELVLFGDAGVAWGDWTRVLTLDPNTGEIGDTGFGQDLWDQKPILSAGIAGRFNVLGALVLEVYYARPFDRVDDRVGVFGINFSPGW
ncbi:MAG: peptidase S9, partial [Rhodothermales bacterium]|nr:peptidase S9 [Rhodothermales bacterium]